MKDDPAQLHKRLSGSVIELFIYENIRKNGGEIKYFRANRIY